MNKILERRHKWKEKHQLLHFFPGFKLILSQLRHHEKELDDEEVPHEEEGYERPKYVSSSVEVKCKCKGVF